MNDQQADIKNIIGKAFYTKREAKYHSTCSSSAILSTLPRLKTCRLLGPKACMEPLVLVVVSLSTAHSDLV